MPTLKKRLNIIVLPLLVISIVCLIFTFSGLNSIPTGSLISAQITDSNPIQILSTSTYTDDLGNFHVIGEVNNTSAQTQTNIEITALLSNTTNGNNVTVGNHSAFSSIGTLRTGELSPFDIMIQNPQQILGKFNFMEFSASSQPATFEKSANLALNGSNSFLDNSGNPHIIGNIINQGQSPEQFLNLVATFYDNTSLGVIGTQTFGLNVGNLTHNQMAPFDITITDNKTKSQGAFYTLNVESTQSSMNSPFNTKTSFVSTAGIGSSGGVGNGLANSSPINNLPVLLNNNDDQESNARDNDDDSGDNDNNNGNDQRGEKKTDDEGNPWFDDNNCSERSGSSGGSSSECEEAEREEESEGEDEDSGEKDQGPPSGSDSDPTNDNNDDGEDNGEKTSDNDNVENNENKGNNDNGNEGDEVNNK